MARTIDIAAEVEHALAEAVDDGLALAGDTLQHTTAELRQHVLPSLTSAACAICTADGAEPAMQTLNYFLCILWALGRDSLCDPLRDVTHLSGQELGLRVRLSRLHHLDFLRLCLLHRSHPAEPRPLSHEQQTQGSCAPSRRAGDDMHPTDEHTHPEVSLLMLDSNMRTVRILNMPSFRRNKLLLLRHAGSGSGGKACSGRTSSAGTR